MILLLSLFFVCMMLVIGLVLCYSWLRHHIVLSLRATTQLEQELKQAQRGRQAGNDNDSNWRESFDEALVAFNCSELTASKTEKRIKSMCVFPVSFDEVMNESVETRLRRFAKAVFLLNEHSIMISGMEQGLLTVLETNLNGINQAVLSNYAGLLTQDSHSIANDLLTSFHSGHMPIDLQSLPHLVGGVI